MFSAIPVVSVFGLLMSMLVLSSFVLVMITSPVILIIFQNYVQYWVGSREFVLWMKVGFSGSIFDFVRQKNDMYNSKPANSDASKLCNGRRPDVGGVENDVLGSEPKRVVGSD